MYVVQWSICIYDKATKSTILEILNNLALKYMRRNFRDRGQENLEATCMLKSPPLLSARLFVILKDSKKAYCEATKTTRRPGGPRILRTPCDIYSSGVYNRQVDHQYAACLGSNICRLARHPLRNRRVMCSCNTETIEARSRRRRQRNGRSSPSPFFVRILANRVYVRGN